MRRLEENVQVHARFVALVFLKNPRDDRPGKARLIRDERESLGGQDGIRLLRGRCVGSSHLAAANCEHVCRYRHADGRSKPVQAISADREPPSRVEKIAGVVADISQLQAGHGAIVRDSSCPSYSKVRVMEASLDRPAGSGTRTVESCVTRSARSGWFLSSELW